MGCCTVGELWTICFTLFNPRVWLLVFSGLLPIKLPSISRSCSTPKQQTVSTFSIEVGFLLFRGCPSSPRPSPHPWTRAEDCWLTNTHQRAHSHSHVHRGQPPRRWGGVSLKDWGTLQGSSNPEKLLLNLQRAMKEKEKDILEMMKKIKDTQFKSLTLGSLKNKKKTGLIFEHCLHQVFVRGSLPRPSLQAWIQAFQLQWIVLSGLEKALPRWLKSFLLFSPRLGDKAWKFLTCLGKLIFGAVVCVSVCSGFPDVQSGGNRRPLNRRVKRPRGATHSPHLTACLFSCFVRAKTSTLCPLHTSSLIRSVGENLDFCSAQRRSDGKECYKNTSNICQSTRFPLPQLCEHISVLRGVETKLTWVTLLIGLAGQEPAGELKNTGSGYWRFQPLQKQKRRDETISLLCCRGNSSCLQVQQQCLTSNS